MGNGPDKTQALNVRRDGTTLHVDLMYPRTQGNVCEVEVELVDVRCADELRISYCFDRDGWVVRQPLAHSKLEEKNERGEVWADKTTWHEVVFIPAWALEAEGANVFEPSTRQDVITQERAKAAESMRERAQEEALTVAKTWRSENSRHAASDIAQAIAKLPLEAVAPAPVAPPTIAECGHVLTGRPPGSRRATCRKAPHGDDVGHRWDEEPGTT